MAKSDRATQNLEEFDQIKQYEESEGGSRIYHEDDIPAVNSLHDDRSRKALMNDPLTGDAGGMLIDWVSFGPGVSSPTHFHDGTGHGFYVLEGEGVIEIDGEEHDVREGSIVWAADSEPHRVFCREGQSMKVMECFPHTDYESTFLDAPACTWEPEE